MGLSGPLISVLMFASWDNVAHVNWKRVAHKPFTCVYFLQNPPRRQRQQSAAVGSSTFGQARQGEVPGGVMATSGPRRVS